MERLNHIMSRTAQRRQPSSQSNEQSDQPLEGATQPGQHLRSVPPRQRLPEQTARLGRQPSEPHGQRNTPVHDDHARPGQTPHPGYLRQHGQANNVRAYQQQQQQPYQQPAQRPAQETEYPPRRARGDYHEVDTYPPAPRADVQEGWEDDTVDMRYGDWEDERNEEHWQPGNQAPGQVYAEVQDSYLQPRPRVERIASTQHSLATRELRPTVNTEPRSHPTRNLRDLRPPTIPSQSPAPRRPAQEAHYTHRVTQPLNTQAIIRMSQETPQDLSRTQSPTRQVAVREQAAVTVSPIPPPTLPTGICPVCKGAGYLRLDVQFGDPHFGKPVPCECKEAERKEKRRRQLREMSNLDAFRDKSFKNFNSRVPGVQEAYRTAAEYAQNPAGWLVLIGKNGCGKTHLAAAIANHHLMRGSLVLFAVVPELLDHLRATFAPSSTVVYDQVFSTMREAELLILDDLGSEQNSPWATEKLFQLLNYRYNLCYPTVITTNNLRLQAVDERIRSRLMDRALVTEVTFERAMDFRPNNPIRG